MESSGARAIECCKTLGMNCYVLTADKSYYDSPDGNPIDAATGYFEYPTDEAHMRQTAEHVAALDRDIGIFQVMSFSELYIHTAAYIARFPGFSSNNYTAISLARDKFMWRRFLSDRGVHMPRFAVVRQKGELEKAARSVGYPCIVKRTQGSSSVSVRYCTNLDEMMDTWEQWQNYQGFGRGVRLKPDMLVEEYVSGPLFSCECFISRGKLRILGFTDRTLSGFPYFSETRASFPARVGNYSSVEKLISESVTLMGFDNCCLHIEFIEDSFTGEPVLVDYNARLAGGLVPQMIREAYGTDPITIAIDIALGRDTTTPIGTKKYATSRYIGVDAEGVLRKIEGYDLLKDNEAVLCLSRSLEDGARVHRMETNRETILEFMVGADDPVKAEGIAESLVGRLRFVVEANLVC